MRPCIERAYGPASSEVHFIKSSTLSSQVLHRPVACGLHCPSAAAVVTKSRNSLVPSPPSLPCVWKTNDRRAAPYRFVGPEAEAGSCGLHFAFRSSIFACICSFSLRHRWSLLLTWRNSRGWLPHPRLCIQSECEEDLGVNTWLRDLLRRQCGDNHFSLCFESCFATRIVQDVTTHTTQHRALLPPVKHFRACWPYSSN